MGCGVPASRSARARRLRLAIPLGAALAALALASTGHAAAPTPLQPASGASFPEKAQIEFRIQTQTDDAAYYVRISRSPSLVGTAVTCPPGSTPLIGDDVFDQYTTVTADPAVESVTADANLWPELKKGGTFYWQAYALIGCAPQAEAPRSFTVERIHELVPPELLSPGDGASFSAGTPLSFAARTAAGDDPDYLFLRVSKSPAPVDACGEIGSDVAIHKLAATADPAVFQVTPPYYTFPAFWMNAPGTYYWQVYRIYVFEGDTCVESPVRTLTIVPAAAPPPAPPPAPLIPALTVPEQVSPADGETFPAGTRLAFTIRTFAGDDPGYLWLLVSRSPQPEDACGTIANEVSIHQFETTADPAVYQARPTYFSGPSFWMNKPGTYYWQAYRIHHGDGADGCIESPVRRLVVGAAALPTAPVKADVPAVQDLAFDGKRFYIRVQYRIRERRLVRLCELGCRASVEIRSRTGRRIYAKRLPGDTALILGKKAVRAIPSGVRVRIDVPIDRTKLLKTKFRTVGNHRVGETRLRVSLVTRSGTALTVRDGAIRVSIARIRSGALPGLQSILAL